jgi:phosphoribosylamine--glycine ligase
MKIAILGSGGREHALAVQISKSKKLDKIYCIPGNAGTDSIGKNVNLELDNFDEIYRFIKNEKIDLVIVGPEKPLVDGIVDYLNEKNIKVFGPNQKVAQLEGSKIFTKKICEKYNIPTANFGIFRDKEETFKFLQNSKMPLVIKADGLAAGKGVYICKDIESSKNAVIEIFNGKFGKADQILVEEFLEGDEMSYFVISDGLCFKSFNTAQDHKRVGEGDTGKNTGGMGSYAPSKLINKNLEEKIINRIIKPTLRAIKDMDQIYNGFLYAGLMIKDNEPYLIEYNVRMGDPECQTILPLLKSDLLDLIIASCNNNLKEKNIEWFEKKSLCIVLCSKGYPESYKKNIDIPNLQKIKSSNNNFIYHAGTKISDNAILAVGGRVLNFVSISDNYLDSRNEAINQIEKLNWKNGFYRSDIGFKVIDK